MPRDEGVLWGETLPRRNGGGALPGPLIILPHPRFRMVHMPGIEVDNLGFLERPADNIVSFFPPLVADECDALDIGEMPDAEP